MIYCGIDVGMKGGACLARAGDPPTPLILDPLPTIDIGRGKKVRNQIDGARAWRDLIVPILTFAANGERVHIGIEVPSTRRGESPAGSLRAGIGTGILHGQIIAATAMAGGMITWEEITGQRWQSVAFVGIPGDNPHVRARLLCAQRYPGFPTILPRCHKIHEGIASAVGIFDYLLRRNHDISSGHGAHQRPGSLASRRGTRRRGDRTGADPEAGGVPILP